MLRFNEKAIFVWTVFSCYAINPFAIPKSKQIFKIEKKYKTQSKVYKFENYLKVK